MSRRHPYRRFLFAAVVLLCWVVGLFGLDRSRMSSFQLPIVVGAGLVGYWLVGVLRRKLEVPAGAVVHEIHEPPPCVVVTRLGEPGPSIRPAAAIAATRVDAAPVIRATRVQSNTTTRNYIPLNS